MGSLSAEPEERKGQICHLIILLHPILEPQPKNMGTKNPFWEQVWKTPHCSHKKKGIWGFPLVLQSAQQLLAWGAQMCDHSFPLHKGTGMYPLH